MLLLCVACYMSFGFEVNLLLARFIVLSLFDFRFGFWLEFGLFWYVEFAL